MAYTVPPLPYAYDALEPHIDKATMEFHHDKHHQAYVDKANAALEGTELGRAARSRRCCRTSTASATRRAPSKTTAAATTTTRCSGRACRPNGGGEPERRAGRGDRLRLRLVRGLPGQAQGNRRQPVRLGLVVARARRLGPRGRGQRQPGQPDLRRQDAAARRRRVGARLLPEVPEPPPRLHRRVVERRRLGARSPSGSPPCLSCCSSPCEAARSAHARAARTGRMRARRVGLPTRRSTRRRHGLPRISCG